MSSFIVAALWRSVQRHWCAVVVSANTLLWFYFLYFATCCIVVGVVRCRCFCHVDSNKNELSPCFRELLVRLCAPVLVYVCNCVWVCVSTFFLFVLPPFLFGTCQFAVCNALLAILRHLPTLFVDLFSPLTSLCYLFFFFRLNSSVSHV